MSYEILLFPREPGQEWSQVLAADDEDGPDLDLAAINRGVARFRRIEAGLREELTEPVRTWVAEELGGDVLGELQTRDSRLRVDLYDRSASVSAPAADPAAPVQDLIRRAVEIVAAETGYEPYDPTRQDTFDGTLDEESARAWEARADDQDDLWAGNPATGQTTGVDTDETAAVAQLEGQVMDEADQERPLDPREERARLLAERRRQIEEQRRDPAVLRRRAWFYVIFGVLMAIMGGLRLAEGDTGILTWLFVGVALFELVGARLLFTQSKLAQEQRDQEATETGQNPSEPAQGPTEASPTGPEEQNGRNEP